MTKVVNSLSAKMEMGSPMISMYLLGNPDHYKSHEFRVFYWQSFVNEARTPWTQKESLEDLCPAKTNAQIQTSVPKATGNEAVDNAREGKVAVIRHKGRVIGISPIHDYIYRSDELVGMSLYDWIARCQRCKLPVKKKKKKSKQARDDQSADETDSLSSDDGHEPPRNQSRRNASTQRLYRFMPEHPLADTHGIRCCPPDKEKVPNFVGPTLPRFDQGDREYYCCTMLTLFKPWRSGLDLKGQDQDWDCAFSTHQFSSRHRCILDNANIRYECLDAKDDFHAQLHKGGVGIGSWGDFDAEVIQDMNQAAMDVNVPFDFVYDPDDVSNVIGKRARARDDMMAVMKKTMQSLGWTECFPKLLPDNLELVPPPPDIAQNSAAWKAAVAQKRAEILELRSRYMPPVTKSTTCAFGSS
jgi:hypothetical protein